MDEPRENKDTASSGPPTRDKELGEQLEKTYAMAAIYSYARTLRQGLKELEHDDKYRKVLIREVRNACEDSELGRL